MILFFQKKFYVDLMFEKDFERYGHEFWNLKDGFANNEWIKK
jgi:hypothetical protein